MSFDDGSGNEETDWARGLARAIGSPSWSAGASSVLVTCRNSRRFILRLQPRWSSMD